VSSVAGGIADSVDAEQVRRVCEWLIPDLVDALRPLAPIIVPEIIRGLGELAGPDHASGSTSAFAAGGER
jgi:hypothetical protein